MTGRKRARCERHYPYGSPGCPSCADAPSELAEGRERAPLTPRSRQAAARARVAIDRKLGEETPDWIKALASATAREQS